MSILIQIKAIFISILLVIFLLVPACIVAIPFKLERRLKIVSPIWSFFGRFLLTFACHARLAICQDYRSSEFKKTPPQGLFIANHQSYIDIPLMLTQFQVPPIMKKEVLYIPIFGQMGWLSGALPVARGSATSRRKVFDQAKKRMIKEKIGLQVYPEGTRSKTGQPKPYSEIKKTLLIFAYNENIPVIPVSLYGTKNVLSSWGIIKPGKNVGILIHQELYPRTFSSPEEFAQVCWSTVERGFYELKNQIDSLNENLS